MYTYVITYNSMAGHWAATHLSTQAKLLANIGEVCSFHELPSAARVGSREEMRQIPWKQIWNVSKLQGRKEGEERAAHLEDILLYE